MALKKLKLTDEHIKLLQAIKFESFVFDGDSRNGRIGWGVDQYGPWGGNFPIEDIALILGLWDKALPGTENDYDGRKFPDAIATHLYDLYADITENFELYFKLLIYMSDKGGLVPGEYKCNKRLNEWTKVE